MNYYWWFKSNYTIYMPYYKVRNKKKPEFLIYTIGLKLIFSLSISKQFGNYLQLYIFRVLSIS